MPKISVIIPTYNRLSYLKRAVASVQNQSFSDWHLWIIDDGSTDGTAHWVKKELLCLDLRIFYFKVENGPKGVSLARNLGWEKAQSSWVAFLDSDDEWLPHKLEKQWEVAQSTDKKIIHTEEIWVRKGVRVNPKKKHTKSGGRIFSQSVLLCCMSPSTVMLHKSLCPSGRPFREDFPVCEDYELWLRLTAQHEVEFIEQPLVVKYGGHEDQLSRKYVAMDYWRVKALMEHLDSKSLSVLEKEVLQKEIDKKTRILLQGYKKHKNWEPVAEVQGWREKTLTHIIETSLNKGDSNFRG